TIAPTRLELAPVVVLAVAPTLVVATAVVALVLDVLGLLKVLPRLVRVLGLGLGVSFVVLVDLAVVAANFEDRERDVVVLLLGLRFGASVLCRPVFDLAVLASTVGLSMFVVG